MTLDVAAVCTTLPHHRVGDLLDQLQLRLKSRWHHILRNPIRLTKNKYYLIIFYVLM